MKTKLYANFNKQKKDGTVSLFAKIQVNGVRGSIQTGIEIIAKAWNQREQKVDNTKGQEVFQTNRAIAAASFLFIFPPLS